MVPTIILLAIWLVFSAVPVYQAVRTRALAVQTSESALPIATALTELGAERTLSMRRLAGLAQPEELQAQRAASDRSVAAMRRALTDLEDVHPAVESRVSSLNSLITQLSRQRNRIDTDQAGAPETLDYYNKLLDTGVELFGAQSDFAPDLESGRAEHVAAQFFRASDRFSRASSLGSTALAAGRFTEDDHLQFVRLAGAYHETFESELPAAEPRAVALSDALTASPDWKQLGAMENRFLESTTAGVNRAQWQQTADAVSARLNDIALAQLRAATDMAVNDAGGRLTGIVVSSLIALGAMLLGILLAVRNARKLVDRYLVSRLERLRDDTLMLASQRLPVVMDRLESGAEVDVEAELAPLNYGDDEIGQVADAFNTAHHTAILAAVNQNQAKTGVNKVFLGIAHRNQGLVHRQLKVLDKMERSEEHPERLDGLFQLDHLATRARRNAENLIILAGEKPGRQWRKPVRLVDVIRSAVAETEHYYRIRVPAAPEVSLVGAAVGDVIHLLAELMDNATAFSPPDSPVQVHCEVTSDGVFIRVADDGLGMRPADRDDANVLLSSTPKFEDITLRGDSRLGLFVVARLAARRGIAVELREGDEQGTTAFVVLPREIVVGEPAESVVEPTAEPAVESTASELTGPVPAVLAPQFPSADPDAPELPRRQPKGVPRSPAADPVDDGTTTYSPERARGNMSAFQEGTSTARRARGRD